MVMTNVINREKTKQMPKIRDKLININTNQIRNKILDKSEPEKRNWKSRNRKGTSKEEDGADGHWKIVYKWNV